MMKTWIRVAVGITILCLINLIYATRYTPEELRKGGRFINAEFNESETVNIGELEAPLILDTPLAANNVTINVNGRAFTRTSNALTIFSGGNLHALTINIDRELYGLVIREEARRPGHRTRNVPNNLTITGNGTLNGAYFMDVDFGGNDRHATVNNGLQIRMTRIEAVHFDNVANIGLITVDEMHGVFFENNTHLNGAPNNANNIGTALTALVATNIYFGNGLDLRGADFRRMPVAALNTEDNLLGLFVNIRRIRNAIINDGLRLPPGIDLRILARVADPRVARFGVNLQMPNAILPDDVRGWNLARTQLQPANLANVTQTARMVLQGTNLNNSTLPTALNEVYADEMQANNVHTQQGTGIHMTGSSANGIAMSAIDEDVILKNTPASRATMSTSGNIDIHGSRLTSTTLSATNTTTVMSELNQTRVNGPNGQIPPNPPHFIRSTMTNESATSFSI